MTRQDTDAAATPSTRRELRARERSVVIPRLVPAASSSPASVAARRRPLAAQVLSLAAMAFVALLTVGLSIPASLFSTYPASSLDADEGYVDVQSLAVSDQAVDPAATRDAYGATSRAQFAQAAAAAAAAAGAARAKVVRGGFNSGTGPIRWPFPSSVPLGPGYGAPATCSTCQKVHQGQDFLAKDGASIYAIADGVVTTHQDSGSFGNHIIITHQIDGQTVTSLYAHMQHGSTALNVGDHIGVGEFIGLVGTTGAVTAPHLHFEITVNGAHVDPYAWLQAHAS